MNRDALLALVKWQVHQRSREAAILMMPLLLTLLVPSVGAIAMVPMLATSGLFVAGQNHEFVYPVSDRMVAGSRVAAALVVRVLPLLAIALFAAWRSTGHTRPGLPLLDVLALGIATALAPELRAYFAPGLRIATRVALATCVSLLVFLLVLSPPAATHALVITLLLVTVAAFVYVLASPARLAVARLAVSTMGVEQAGRGGRGDAPVVVSATHDDAAPVAGERIGAGFGLRDIMLLWYAQSGRLAYLSLLPMLFMCFLPMSSNLLMLGLLGSALSVPVTSMVWLDVYPVPRRVQLAMLTLVPAVLTVVLGIGQTVPTRFSAELSLGAPQSVVDGRTFYGDPTRVPLTYWETAPRFTSVQIVSPWGERVEAHMTTVGRWRFYNPFSTAPQSSAQFVAWQRAHMTSVVYGQVVSPEALRHGDVPLRRTQSWSMLLMQGALFLTWTLLLVCAALVTRAGTGWRGWRAVSLPFLPIAAAWWELMRGLDNGSVVIPLLQRTLLLLEQQLPTRLLAIPLAMAPVALVLWLLAFLLARRQPGLLLPSMLQAQAALDRI